MATPEKYSRLQIILHWAIAALMVVSFITHEAMGEAWDAVEDGGIAVIEGGARIHQLVGLTILALAVVRIILRLTKGAPAPVPAPKLQDLAAKITHIGLYVVIFALPITGMMAVGAGIEAAAEFHEPLFQLGMVLILLHVGAALYHQFIVKDNLMARMR